MEGTRILATSAALELPVPAPGVDVLFPTGWVGSWNDATAAFGAGDGRAASLMANGCATTGVTTDFGWTVGGNASVYGAIGFDGAFATLDAVLSVGSTSLIIPAIPGWAIVPAGPLTLTLRLQGDTAGCVANGWSRVRHPHPAFRFSLELGSAQTRSWRAASSGFAEF